MKVKDESVSTYLFGDQADELVIYVVLTLPIVKHDLECFNTALERVVIQLQLIGLHTGLWEAIEQWFDHVADFALGLDVLGVQGDLVGRLWVQ